MCVKVLSKTVTYFLCSLSVIHEHGEYDKQLQSTGFTDETEYVEVKRYKWWCSPSSLPLLPGLKLEYFALLPMGLGKQLVTGCECVPAKQSLRSSKSTPMTFSHLKQGGRWTK